CRPHAAHRARTLAVDAVVPGLSSRAAEVSAPARQGVRDGLAISRSAEARTGIDAQVPHRYTPPDGLFDMPSLDRQGIAGRASVGARSRAMLLRQGTGNRKSETSPEHRPQAGSYGRGRSAGGRE